MTSQFFNPEYKRPPYRKTADRPAHCQAEDLVASIATMRWHLDQLEKATDKLRHDIRSGKSYAPGEVEKCARRVAECNEVLQSTAKKMLSAFV